MRAPGLTCRHPQEIAPSGLRASPTDSTVPRFPSDRRRIRMSMRAPAVGSFSNSNHSRTRLSGGFRSRTSSGSRASRCRLPRSKVEVCCSGWIAMPASATGPMAPLSPAPRGREAGLPHCVTSRRFGPCVNRTGSTLRRFASPEVRNASGNDGNSPGMRLATVNPSPDPPLQGVIQ